MQLRRPPLQFGRIADVIQILGHNALADEGNFTRAGRAAARPAAAMFIAPHVPHALNAY